jgi:cell division septal protein FtsQ
VVLTQFVQSQTHAYPLVTGPDAGREAERILRLVAMHEGLAKRLKMAELLGNGRWNLHSLKGGVIKVSADNPALDLARLVRLEEWSMLLDRQNVVIDLRHPGHIYVGRKTANRKQV